MSFLCENLYDSQLPQWAISQSTGFMHTQHCSPSLVLLSDSDSIVAYLTCRNSQYWLVVDQLKSEIKHSMSSDRSRCQALIGSRWKPVAPISWISWRPPDFLITPHWTSSSLKPLYVSIFLCFLHQPTCNPPPRSSITLHLSCIMLFLCFLVLQGWLVIAAVGLSVCLLR